LTNHNGISMLVEISLYINRSINYSPPPIAHGATDPSMPRPLIIEASRSHSVRHTTHSRTPLDKWSARCRNLYLTTYNTHKRQTSMSLAVFEPTLSASEWPQTHTLDRVATAISIQLWYYYWFQIWKYFAVYFDGWH
jgi:hypothetical protein